MHRGTTSVTLRHVATRVADRRVVAEAEMVFVMIDRAGRPVPMSEELGRFFGPRGPGGPARDAKRVAVEGAELVVEVRGDGVPVLFVHGFPLDRAMWRHQLAVLTRCRRIAPDLRGAGASSAPADGYSMGRYADDLVAVLDALEVPRAVVCGLSMGGYVAFELVRRYPDRLAGLVLCDTRAESDTEEGRRSRDELATLAEHEGAAAVAERMLPKMLAPTTVAEQPELVAEVRAMMQRAPVAGLVGALRAMRERPDSTPVLPAIRVPTLVIVGEEDQVTPPAGVERMAAAIPGARVARIPAAGHLAPLEQPIPTSSALAEFLAGLA
jgi:pimeloyl-ACP methyl ester carboxylesterase